MEWWLMEYWKDGMMRELEGRVNEWETKGLRDWVTETRGVGEGEKGRKGEGEKERKGEREKGRRRDIET
jgi:hypothetical protein